MKKDTKFLINEIEGFKTMYHPNIVQLHEVITDEKQIHLIMQYLPGPTLDDPDKMPSQKDMWNYSR